MEGKKLAYSEDAILLGKLSVPNMYFIKKFALHGTCSGLNGLVRIMFDVPYVDGKDLHNVTINLFDVSGRLVHQIASGQYLRAITRSCGTARRQARGCTSCR